MPKQRKKPVPPNPRPAPNVMDAKLLTQAIERVDMTRAQFARFIVRESRNIEAWQSGMVPVPRAVKRRCQELLGMPTRMLEREIWLFRRRNLILDYERNRAQKIARLQEKLDAALANQDDDRADALSVKLEDEALAEKFNRERALLAGDEAAREARERELDERAKRHA
ncbi:MAG TPA: hypothetical protein VJS69_01235 [Candidatus Krumholzibacteria bacterium]|nr:hypothetical protein [Candidatus Krumholzibacteria bacterium]